MGLFAWNTRKFPRPIKKRKDKVAGRPQMPPYNWIYRGGINIRVPGKAEKDREKKVKKIDVSHMSSSIERRIVRPPLPQTKTPALKV